MQNEPIRLGAAQISTLEHAYKLFGLGSGWEIADDYINRSLIDLGLIEGTWIGSVKNVPIPYWTISNKGKEVLKQYGKL